MAWEITSLIVILRGKYQSTVTLTGVWHPVLRRNGSFHTEMRRLQVAEDLY